jgi:flavin-dependent dehydrogenase
VKKGTDSVPDPKLSICLGAPGMDRAVCSLFQTTRSITILGGGPAGASAAISALNHGASCRLIEKSKFPRHKVCGEFFSPEIQAELALLGVWDAFQSAGPARIERMRLCFGSRETTSRLSEAAWGLSRHAFDSLMFQRAIELGAVVSGETKTAPDVIACGRKQDGSPRGRRLFGFKAHFDGPTGDAVELFFFRGCYVGVAPIENGLTNVCGLGPEDFLKRFDFDFDAVVTQSPALTHRLRPLTRAMKWISTGPLQYRQAFDNSTSYLAGDALSFVDPFTGSGLLSALKTGSLAGMAAARGELPVDHLTRCRAALRKPFEVSSIFRRAIASGLADRLIGLVPARALFTLTRPR